MKNFDTDTSLSNILIVDDDSAVILALRKVLDKLGRTRFATDGLQALEMVRQAQPDLILLDMEMPGMNGRAVCAALKADPETADIPVIFISGHTDQDFEESVFDAGAVDFVAKPLNPRVVAARVQTQLGYRKTLAQLHALASKDGLTNLNNRRGFDEQLAQEWKRALRQKLPLALLMIDIDEFKIYNDHHGHLEGDTCLKSVALALQNSVRRPADFVARYGGEEFALILPETDAEGAYVFAQMLLENVESLGLPQAPNAKRQSITVSIGYSVLGPAHFETVGLEAIALIKSADLALYQSKKKGRNCSNFYELALPAI